MEITNYIESELYIIVPVLYVMGILFKKSEAIDDRWIPIVLGILGVILACIYKFTAYEPNSAHEILGVIYAGITQGILCAAGSVYANNLIKQMKKDGDDKDNKNVG